ncbi:MAG: hypothetical protein JSS69_06035 [Acidobacteria bacterium]|nr:hypothetical protein [Acidobacteriota bacterium]MBS1865461.1 hypothetical protein [Acidobacteriota bacterium]
MQKATFGFRVHSGWAAMVAVSLEKGEPVVLVRRKLLLVKTFSYTFRQPYHTAEKIPPVEAAEFVRGVEKESRELALAGIRAVQKELSVPNYKIAGCALLLASGRTLPEFEKILASHALIHTADGKLFRESIRHSCARAKLSLTAIKERDLLAEAAKRLKKRPEYLTRKVADLGKSLGPPWTQDEKFATLAAWLTLVQ